MLFAAISAISIGWPSSLRESTDDTGGDLRSFPKEERELALLPLLPPLPLLSRSLLPSRSSLESERGSETPKSLNPLSPLSSSSRASPLGSSSR